MTALIDTHCHLNHADYEDDLQAVVERAHTAGIAQMICVGWNVESSARAIELAETIEGMYAVVGVHPHDAEDFDAEALVKLAGHEKVVGIGETGLDYFRNHCPHDVQKEAFRRQIAISNDLCLPLVIHCRDAYADVFDILRAEGVPDVGAVMHCFAGDTAIAMEALELGCTLGITGNITFKNAKELQAAVSTVPLERLIVETDCPYLTPHPFRGKRNEPAYLPRVAEGLAVVKGVDTEAIARITTENAEKIFGLRIA